MIKHYFKVAFRNLVKYKTQSLVSIIGLAVGFTCFALSVLWIRYEMTYDTFHNGADRIYMVRAHYTDSPGSTSNVTPYPLANYLQEKMPEIEAATAFTPHHVKFRLEETEQEVGMIDADSVFMNFFNIRLLKGTVNFLKENDPEIAILGFRYVVSFFFLCVSLLFGKRTADQFDRIVEGIVVRIYFNLCKNRGCGFEDSSAEKLSTDGVLQVVADIALTHGRALRQRHGRDGGVRFRGGVERRLDHADLRTVAVADDDLVALADYLGDVLCGHHDVLKLVFAGRGLASCLKSVSAESNNNFFHNLTVLPFFEQT